MKYVSYYLNPIARLGHKKYSIFPALITVTLVSVFSEVFAKLIVQNPDVVGVYGIFLFVILIVYFAFRDGIVGGLTASIVTILYYLYIVYDRDSTPAERHNQIELIASLFLMYLVLAGIIGWLKQTIDRLIERESDERARLESIIEQLPVGIGITDHLGNLVRSNQQTAKMMGRPVRKNLVAGKDTHESATYNGQLVKPEDWPIAESLRTGLPVVGKQYELKREDGSVVHLQISANVIRNKKNKIIAAATILNDITETKEMELRKDDFINMASHELKTPLTSMKLYIESLLKKTEHLTDPKVAHMLTNLKGQTTRLQGLVNDMLDVSRLQTGKLALRKEDFELTEHVKTTINGLKPIVSQRIEFKIDETTKYFVHADKFRIEQVLTNIMTNAAKYSPPSKRIIVSMFNQKNQVVVSVQDFGIGISKNHQKKIFERLYQVTEPYEKTFPGLGMGLFISKEIITRHLGRIWVESAKGKGSTFYISLPIVKKVKENNVVST